MINEHKMKTHVLVLGMEGVGKSLLIKRIKSIADGSKSNIEIGFETNPTVSHFCSD
jgi:hypothetical protein